MPPPAHAGIYPVADARRAYRHFRPHSGPLIPAEPFSAKLLSRCLGSHGQDDRVCNSREHRTFAVWRLPSQASASSTRGRVAKTNTPDAVRSIVEMPTVTIMGVGVPSAKSP